MTFCGKTILFFDELEWQTYNCVCMHACVCVYEYYCLLISILMFRYQDSVLSLKCMHSIGLWLVDTKALVVASLWHCWYMISKFIFSF